MYALTESVAKHGHATIRIEYKCGVVVHACREEIELVADGVQPGIGEFADLVAAPGRLDARGVSVEHAEKVALRLEFLVLGTQLTEKLPGLVDSPCRLNSTCRAN